MINVVILGGGNVAHHLTTQLLKNDTINLVQVYNRSIEKIQHLKNSTSITNKLSELKDADIYIISVSDNAISSLSSKINFKEKLVVHTSGGVAMKDLLTISNKGVFYLLQSFSKEREVNFSTIPICLEAENEKDLKLLSQLASKISNTVHIINSEQREKLHLAAVFVNNFVNVMYKIGHDICNTANVPFEILKPLILETASKIDEITPYEAQTGPARRNDTKTTEKHETMLLINQREIYTLLTKSINNTYGEKL
ncbi:Rossmann-like and DUF2520 domain-containing protein [uncultured Lutibacter sp.]|uniref:Rossmann-like and DUF2520 domain-containing protein n=1 Tax=uncultured Lutibacter sp. TaxID=437739 RepID=UPI002622C1CA|nr:F420-dependent NADP oxidoreductase [uncultured Lutibacter sp.]